MAFYRPVGAGETRDIRAQVEPELRAWAESLAERTGGTLSGVVRMALREYKAKIEGNDNV